MDNNVFLIRSLTTFIYQEAVQILSYQLNVCPNYGYFSLIEINLNIRYLSLEPASDVVRLTFKII